MLTGSEVECVSTSHWPILFLWQPLGGRIEVALFNVTADPNERVDLSKKYPDIVKEMQARLEAYKKSAVPCIYKGKDPRALETARKNGVWGPCETWTKCNKSACSSSDILVAVLGQHILCLQFK